MSIFDSNRTGHITAALLGGVGFAALGYATGNTWLFKAGLWCPGWEAIATMDMDHKARGLSGDFVRKFWVSYWKPYAWMVPHRSDFSHSLLLGTPLRMVYGSIFPLALWFGWQYMIHSVTPLDVWRWFSAGVETPGDWWTLTQVTAARLFRIGWFFKWFFVGSLMADFIHLCKDGYPVKYGFTGVVFGRDLSRKLFKSKQRKVYRR